MNYLKLPLEPEAASLPSLPYSQAFDQRRLTSGRQSSEVVEWWNILRRRKGTVILAGFVGLLLGTIITIPQTPVYQARASLEVQDLNQQFINLKEVSPVTESTAINALNDLQTQIKILQSEVLTDRTIDRLKNESTVCPVGRGGGAGFWYAAIDLLKATPKRKRSQLLDAAAKTLQVLPVALRT